MKNIFESIKYFFLANKERNLQKKLKNTTKRSFTNKTSKTILGNGTSVTLNTETQKLIEFVNSNVTAIVQKTKCDPERLLEYIKTLKTPVYRIKNADKFLRFINEEEGLIFEQHGFCAIYLSIITRQWPKLKTSAMFVLRPGEIEKFYMLHHFYKWFALKSDLPGYDYESQKKFKNFLSSNTEEAIKRLSMEDIIMLKEAIARDQEATTFVIEYTKEVEGSKKVLDKIKNNGGADI